MSIFEYDEEKHMKSERKEWREIGYREGREEGLAAGREAGHAEGIKIGSDTLARLLKSLMDAGETEKLQRALSDSSYREQLYQEYFSGSKQL